jgi:replication-associated recombination protein RarA
MSAMESLFEMNSQQSIEFPKPLADEFRPMRIDNFCGLHKQRKVLSAFVKAPRPCAFLFVGQPGCGKTAMGLALAAELDATLWHVGSQDCTVDRLRELWTHLAYVPKSGLRGFHLVLCDEIDTASDAALKALLSKLDSTERLANVIWIFTCNSDETLDARFISRTLRLDFNSYGASSEIADLLARIWTLKAPTAPAPDFKKMAVGNVRESLSRLEIEILSA